MTTLQILWEDCPELPFAIFMIAVILIAAFRSKDRNGNMARPRITRTDSSVDFKF